METIFGQKCIIFNKDTNKLLVLKRSNYKNDADLWDFVGGKVDFGEDSKVAIKREAKEETSLTLMNPQIIDLHSRIVGSGNFFIFGLYFCDFFEGEVQLSPEHVDFKWVSVSEFKTLPLRNTVEHVKDIIIDYLGTVEDYY